jgi:glycosyltransferase involved in cell wall biosynthesis
MAVEKSTYNVQELGLAAALVRKGHTCDLLFWTDKEEREIFVPVEGDKGVRVFYKQGKAILKNAVFTNIGSLIDKYDVIQPCEYNQIEAWYLAMKYPEKTVIFHGPYYSPYNKKYNMMCRLFDILFKRWYIYKGTQFVVKSRLAEKFLEKKGIAKENIRVVGVGIDESCLKKDENDNMHSFAEKMKEQKDGMKLLYIGRIEPRRNPFFLIGVMRIILKTHPDSKLYLIGTGDKNYVDSVFEYAEKVGVSDAIIWKEKVEQKYMSDIYLEADIFLLPTEYDIFGMVLLEAMYYKCCVLSTENGGSDMLIDNGKNGFVLHKSDSEVWAKQIINLYEDKALLEKIQNAASERVAKGFLWDHLADGFLEEYARVGALEIEHERKAYGYR